MAPDEVLLARKESPVIIGYCRIAAIEPMRRLALQRNRLAAIGAERFYSERIGPFRAPIELERAIEETQTGDVLAVTRPYRLARSRDAILALIDRLGQKGVGLRILDTPVDTSTTTGRMLLGSAPLWSLGISPWQSLAWDLSRLRTS